MHVGHIAMWIVAEMEKIPSCQAGNVKQIIDCRLLCQCCTFLSAGCMWDMQPLQCASLCTSGVLTPCFLCVGHEMTGTHQTESCLDGIRDQMVDAKSLSVSITVYPAMMKMHNDNRRTTPLYYRLITLPITGYVRDHIGWGFPAFWCRLVFP